MRITRLIVLFLVTGLSPAVLAHQNNRSLTVEVRSGKALDGRGKLWAVVIGVSRYRNVPAESQLRFAHRDAQQFAEMLRSPNGGGFPSDQVKVLLNDVATLSAMRTALGTWLPRSVEADDIVYIFFAGHGVVENEQDGYLMAHDSDPQNLYATALPIAELNRIIAERLKCRLVVLIADACHSGRLGWSSRGTESRALIGRYLDEVGKSSGVFRLLATRADERSYEDQKWGGGHGAFTHFMLEGLRGLGDRDSDGVVRVGELINYLSDTVPEATQALQHPRVAGDIDPRMPLAVISDSERSVTGAARNASLEVRGAPETEVYVDNAYRGRIRPNGILVVDSLKPGSYELSVSPPNAEAFSQKVRILAGRLVVNLKPANGGSKIPVSSPLVAQIRKALELRNVLDNGGAWPLYQRLIKESPNEPQRLNVETQLIGALEEIGQQAINEYVHSPISQLTPGIFRRGAIAFGSLKMLGRSGTDLDAKHFFCEGRALIVEGRPADALVVLRQAVSLDPKAAYALNALGVAFEKTSAEKDALGCFERAAALAPNWPVPRLHLGIHYYNERKTDRAEAELKQVVDLYDKYPLAALLLARISRERGRHSDAEKAVRAIIATNPNYAPAHAELGFIYEAKREYPKAVEAFENYLRFGKGRDETGAYDPDKIRERVTQIRRSTQSPTLKR